MTENMNPAAQAAQAHGAANEAPQSTIISNQEITPEITASILEKANAIRQEKGIKRIYPIVIVGDEFDEKPLYVGYFKRPDFPTFSMFMNKVNQDSVQASRMLAQNCFVDGDRELLNDDDLFLYGLMNQLTVLIDNRHAELVQK